MKGIFFILIIIYTSIQAQEIISYNGNNDQLEKRWSWAIEKAEQSQDNNYWIVYTFERLMPENSTIGHYYNGENKGKTLAELLYPDKPIDYIQSLKGTLHKRSDKEIKKEIALLFKMENNTVQMTDMSTIDLHVKLIDLPVYWLGLTSEQQSINKIIKTYDQLKSEEARETLITAAGMHKSVDESFTFLKGVIQSDIDNELREDAVFWIGHIDNPEVLPFLKETALNAHSNDIQEKAVFSLHTIDNEAATDAIIYIARQASGEVREKAIFWLGQMASKKAVQSLENIVFSDDETEIQKQAVFALSQLDDNKGIPKLIKIAQTHPNPKIRKNAIFWLGESEDERALDALIEMAKN